jgi:hypothetical protein
LRRIQIARLSTLSISSAVMRQGPKPPV